ncbi:MAG: hypothetical protein AB8H80_14365 [Planctomycetota bacterium]
MDPFGRAERALQRDDLLTALRAYDAVPVDDEQYPQARAGAVEVELRMRRSHEMLVEALQLRSEWRDEEALAQLELARAAWSKLPGLEDWLAATRQRIELFAGSDARPAAAGSGSDGPQEVIMVDPSGWMPAAPMGESAPEAQPGVIVLSPANPAASKPSTSEPSLLPASRVGGSSDGEASGRAAAVGPQEVPTEPSGPHAVDPAQAAVPLPLSESRPDASFDASSDAELSTPSTPPQLAASMRVVVQPEEIASVENPAHRLPNGDDSIAQGLVQVEMRLGRGEFEGAVQDLVKMAERCPDDMRLRRRLGQVLHQRALLRYGLGELALAVDDWREVLEIDPSNANVRDLLDRAVRELGPAKQPR